MQEKECKPITEEFIEKFLMEAQSHSGLPIINPISIYYAKALSIIRVPDDLLNNVMDSFISDYMYTSHEICKRNKKWRSCDW